MIDCPYCPGKVSNADNFGTHLVTKHWDEMNSFVDT